MTRELSKSDLALTVALLLAAVNKPLTVEEIQERLTESDYEIAADLLAQVLAGGPFYVVNGRWALR